MFWRFGEKTSRGRNIRCWQLLLKRYLTNDFIRQSSQKEPNSVWQTDGQPGAPSPFLAVGVAQAKAHILLLPIHGLVGRVGRFSNVRLVSLLGWCKVEDDVVFWWDGGGVILVMVIMMNMMVLMNTLALMMLKMMMMMLKMMKIMMLTVVSWSGGITGHFPSTLEHSYWISS